ncbi:peptidoglycan editing factor PgeF [Terrabacter aerolatus]|uniref:Laccase domain protein n=1 Tax=Terrabacter aerolatus TaxID=422442 RepID=A0A512CXS8_9MICO|nr:polyphenol oxidase family protein [Terrabacter aerolatus]GEO29019.1 laccase domain protein [Terrabacter aerolatus]
MFYWRTTIASDGESYPVDVGFTGRSSGRGRGPYAGLNLGGHVGDDPADVEGNRAALADELDVPRGHLVLMNQVHGADVVEVDGPWGAQPPAVDGIVTRTRGLALGVLVADCVPVLLHDARAGVVGAVHAGRPGMLAGIVGRAVGAMRDLGATSVSATVGPSVCGRCYEVPPEMSAAAASVAPSSAARSWTGTPAIDVAAGVVEQLASADVAVRWIPGCSRESADLYSYRRDGRTGRFAGVVALREVAS